MAIFFKERYIGERYELLRGSFTHEISKVPRLAGFKTEEGEELALMIPAANRLLGECCKEQSGFCEVVCRAYRSQDFTRYKLLWIVENRKEEQCW